MLGVDRWGTFPAWLAALGTVGALIGVAVGLNRERQARRRDERDRDAAQARLVVAWPERGANRMGSVLRYYATVANYSQLPVREVKMFYAPIDVPIELAVLPPNPESETHAFDVPVDSEEVPNEGRAITLEFVDARGLRWRRPQNGDPERIIG